MPVVIFLVAVAVPPIVSLLFGVVDLRVVVVVSPVDVVVSPVASLLVGVIDLRVAVTGPVTVSSSSDVEGFVVASTLSVSVKSVTLVTSLSVTPVTLQMRTASTSETEAEL